MNRFSILILSIAITLNAQESTISIASFENGTDQTYIVYTRSSSIETESGPVYAAKSSGWRPVIVLRPHESGVLDILVKDPEMFGLQIKLVLKNGHGKTFFLKGGIRESGDCKQNWLEGPFSVIVAESEKALNESIKYFDEIKRIRVCGYRDTYINVKILPDTIQLANEHNAKILN